MLGLDYAWADPKPAPALLRAAGVRFIARYLSHDPSKNLVLPELRAALAAGLPVVTVWEQAAERMLGGRAAGTDDAQNADGQAALLGLDTAVLYFACDFDVTPAQQAAVNGYLDGAAGVIGRDRTGIYGGYWPVKRALDAGKAAFAWQTYAWSGGNWDPRAQIRQTHNGVTVAGASADWDESETADFGQWPRPGAAPPPPPPPAPSWTEILVNSLPTLVLNASGEDVRSAQGLLCARGHVTAVDGSYGPATRTAVTAFQRAAGLTPDAAVGPATWRALLHR